MISTKKLSETKKYYSSKKRVLGSEEKQQVKITKSLF